MRIILLIARIAVATALLIIGLVQHSMIQVALGIIWLLLDISIWHTENKEQ